jgi:hypothetical protein
LGIIPFPFPNPGLGIATTEGPIVGVLVLYVLQTNLAHFGTW